MHDQDRAGASLNDAVGRRTKHCDIQFATATSPHHHHVRLLFLSKVNDLSVGLSNTHCRSELEGLALVGWNQRFEVLSAEYDAELILLSSYKTPRKTEFDLGGGVDPANATDSPNRAPIF